MVNHDDLSRLSEEQTLRMLFDAMPQLGWTARADGWIDHYNRGWYEYTGTTLGEMKGWGWTKVLDPDELSRVMDSWKRSIASGKPWELEFPLRRHDGVYRWFLSRATPTYDARGTLVRWVGIHTDIDDQKRAQRQLAELDREKTTLFSNVSHELRTPLTMILGPIEDALRAPARALAGAELERVQGIAACLLELVNTLPAYARMEPACANASFAPTDIAALTRDLPDAIRGARVVLADDNTDMRDYLRRLLGASFDVEAVADGDEALAAARRRRPDLILTDVMMPARDGFGLLRALRTDPSLQRVPVIMLSARAGEQSRVDGFGAGADDYLVKPFSARELIARVVAHLQLAKLRETVERERRVLELFVEHAPAELAMFDREMRYLAASRRWRTAYRTPDDVIGRCHYDLFPDIPAVWREAHRRTLAGETLSSGEDRFDHADGSMQWVTWETRPWYESNETIGGLILATEDITADVLARRALEDARREAEAANRAKDDFMAMLGHELRNPLAPILTAVQLMRLRGVEANASKLEVIERQAKHMLRLVDDLLDVSRIARGKVALSREPIELASVVAKAIEMAEPLVEANRHDLTVEVPRSGLEVDVDPTRMAQVVSNLLTNAAKYTPSQGRIVVRARREGDDAVLEVQDNGIGIAPELLPRVFDRFAQGRQGIERAQGGLGLGLAIVRSLVALHGGSVSAASAGPDRGSSFTIRLPALRARGQATPASSHPANQGPRDESMRVLVVDDNQDAAQLTAEAVTAAGYQSDIAYDGLQALEHALTNRPDIVLLDIGLPLLDGYEVARRLRETTGASCPNLVAITGYGQDSDFHRSKDAGFDAHIVKPVNLDHLIAVLEEQCQRRRAGRTRKS